jgi:DNA polymerase III epsilon subunit-like protein
MCEVSTIVNEMTGLPYRRVLVFDVETTGLLPKENYKNSADLKNFPHIIQLSFILFDVIDYKVIQKYNAYIRIDDKIQISDTITKITHINSHICQTYGVDIKDALRAFYEAYMNTDCVIAHNLAFDSEMIMVEMQRNHDFIQVHMPKYYYLFDPTSTKLQNIRLYCTMQDSIEICNLMVEYKTKPGKFYKKFPKLEELYKHLFQHTPENLHNSMIDTLLCLRCFLKLKKNIDINESGLFDCLYQEAVDENHPIEVDAVDAVVNVVETSAVDTTPDIAVATDLASVSVSANASAANVNTCCLC